jgi:multidrug resistance efflux pump
LLHVAKKHLYFFLCCSTKTELVGDLDGNVVAKKITVSRTDIVEAGEDLPEISPQRYCAILAKAQKSFSKNVFLGYKPN